MKEFDFFRCLVGLIGPSYEMVAEHSACIFNFPSSTKSRVMEEISIFTIQNAMSWGDA